MDLSHLTLVLFGIFSSVRVVSYAPQIYKVAVDCNRASAISYATWIIWTGANISTALYAAVNLQDRYLAIVSTIYAVCCIVVLGLTYAKRSNLAKRTAQALARTKLRRSGLSTQLRLAAHRQAAFRLYGQPFDPLGEMCIKHICRQMLICDVLLFVLSISSLPLGTQGAVLPQDRYAA